MKTGQQDTSHGNANGADKQPLNTELVQMKPIPDTPFIAVLADEKWFLTLGKYRLSEPKDNYEQCVEDSKDASWLRIMQVIQIMIEADKEEERKKIKNAEQIAIHKKLSEQPNN